MIVYRLGNDYALYRNSKVRSVEEVEKLAPQLNLELIIEVEELSD
jgi:hypothetical protein